MSDWLPKDEAGSARRQELLGRLRLYLIQFAIAAGALALSQLFHVFKRLHL